MAKPTQNQPATPTTTAEKIKEALRFSEEVTRKLNAVVARKVAAAATSQPSPPARPSGSK